MTRAFALDILDLRAAPEDREIFNELLEEHVFEVREYFLRQPVISELFRSRIRKLEQLSEAAEVLGFPLNGKGLVFSEFDFSNAKTLDAVFDLHQQGISEIRLAMSSTLNTVSLMKMARRLTLLQDEYEAQLLQLSANYGTDERHVKASETTDSGRLAHLFKHSPNEFKQALAQERKRISLIHERRGLL